MANKDILKHLAQVDRQILAQQEANTEVDDATTNRMMLVSEEMNGFADPHMLYAPENIYVGDKNSDDNDENSQTENTAA